MTLRYRALLIGNSTYPEDSHNLPSLEGPVNDVTLLRSALEDNRIGMFAPGNVTVRPERTSHELIRALDDFFTPATRDDVLLLYYSGHGVLDHTATLFLCARDTRVDRLRGTAISSQRLNELIDASAANRIVIILDCCHSGAFKGAADLTGALTGQGRYVLTSCRGRELANDATVANHASLFTDFIVRGLRGEAPHDPGSEYLTVEELYEYVRDSLLEHGRQRPQQAFRGEGGLPVARIVGDAPPRRRPDCDDLVTVQPRTPTSQSLRRWLRPLLVAAAVLVVAAAATVGAIALSGDRGGPGNGPGPGGQLHISAVNIEPVRPQAGQIVHFGYTLDGTAQTTQWTVTSGSVTVTSNSASVFEFTFPQPGTYHVRLVVQNGDARDQLDRDLVVAPPPPPNTKCGETITKDRVVNTDLNCRDVGLTIGAANIKIDLGGHTISGTGTGVVLNGSADLVSVTNGTLTGFATGFKLQEANDVQLTNVTVAKAKTAVSLLRSARLKVQGGSFDGTSAFVIVSSVGTTIDSATVTGTISLSLDSNETLLRGNKINNSLVSTSQSDKVRIIGNTFAGKYSGIKMDVQSRNGVIDRNTFSGADIGVNLREAPGLTISNNDFTGGGVGVRFVFREPGRVAGLAITDNRFTDQEAAGVLIQAGKSTASPGVKIVGNTFTNNGRSPSGMIDSRGRPVNDGLHIDLPSGSDLVVQGNKATNNANYGIEAPVGSVSDGGSNTSSGDPSGCLGVTCSAP